MHQSIKISAPNKPQTSGKCGVERGEKWEILEENRELEEEINSCASSKAIIDAANQLNANSRRHCLRTKVLIELRQRSRRRLWLRLRLRLDCTFNSKRTAAASATTSFPLSTSSSSLLTFPYFQIWIFYFDGVVTAQEERSRRCRSRSRSRSRSWRSWRRLSDDTLKFLLHLSPF